MTMLGWMVLELTDSPWLVALMGFFASAPLIILGLIGGMLADKLDRAKLLVFTQTITLIATLGMGFLLVFEKQQYWHAYIVSAVIGAGWAIGSWVEGVDDVTVDLKSTFLKVLAVCDTPFTM